MKWVLVVAWMGAGSSGVDVTTWPTLAECFAVGERVTDQYEHLYPDAHTASFTCNTSTGTKPTCGGTGMAPCGAAN